MRKYNFKRIAAAIIILALIVFGIVFLILRLNEDSWTRDSRGLYIRHGNPSFVSIEVDEQQTALSCASELYASENLKGINFSSQCLGRCGNYSIDIVHVPRTSEDNLAENQCSDYANGVTSKFIELNGKGQIVRIKD